MDNLDKCLEEMVVIRKKYNLNAYIAVFDETGMASRVNSVGIRRDICEMALTELVKQSLEQISNGSVYIN